MTRDVLSPAVREALEGGNKIEAIKRLRESTGLGLAEAAKVVEAIQKELGAGGSGSASMNLAAALRAMAAARPAERQGSPGEVATSGSGAKWFFLIAIAAIAIAAALYY